MNLSDPDINDEESHCPVVISLTQKKQERKCELDIGFKIYKCDLGTKALDEQLIRNNTSVSCHPYQGWLS